VTPVYRIAGDPRRAINRPDWLTFTPDGKMVYIANHGANNVSAVDIQTLKVDAVILVGEVSKRNANSSGP
jgi:YVTN family beta-propeller protein